MTTQRSGRATFFVLAVAIAIVATILYWPAGGPRDRSPARAGDEVADAPGDPRAPEGPGGVAARQVTTAAVGRVQADIIDSAGEPVDGATVVLRCLLADGSVRSIEGGTVRTDDDGRLEGPGCRGSVCVRLEHAALVPEEPWTLEPGRPATLRARGLSRIWGEVVDQRGEPIPAATLVAARDPEDDDPRALLPVTTSTSGTDADGSFSLALIARPPCDPCAEAAGECPDGPLPVMSRLLLVARAPGFGPGEAIVDIDAADEPVKIVLPPPAPGLHGTLRDPDGQPYPRAYVLARSLSRATEQYRGSASDGTYVIENLGEGEYHLRAIQDGIELSTAGPAGPGEEVDLVGPELVSHLVLELHDEDGRPLAGVRVHGGPWARATTDATGRVTAEGVATGTYMVRVKRPGQRADVHTFEVGAAGAGEGSPEADMATPGASAQSGSSQIVRIRVPGPAKR